MQCPCKFFSSYLFILFIYHFINIPLSIYIIIERFKLGHNVERTGRTKRAWAGPCNNNRILDQFFNVPMF